jgi:2-polyprenyl-6-methoxyphenol hydroxylase-like FAD-dependent oxidoreductase
MTEMTTKNPTVFICGAGPAGLNLALWLTKQNVKVHIVDKLAAVSTESRALAVHARTLEPSILLDVMEHIRLSVISSILVFKVVAIGNYSTWLT